MVGLNVAIFVFIGSTFLWLMLFEKRTIQLVTEENRNIIKGFKQ
jgi:hypothetical protein